MNTPELTLEELTKLEDLMHGVNVHPRTEATIMLYEKLPALLSLARLQIEQRGLPGGPSSARSACAPPAHSDAPRAWKWVCEFCHETCNKSTRRKLVCGETSTPVV